MMTNQQIFDQAIALPFKEREELIRKLEISLKNYDRLPEVQADEIELSIDERSRIVDELRGIASVPGKTPPTDEEWREERTNYLLEKYK